MTFREQAMRQAYLIALMLILVRTDALAATVAPDMSTAGSAVVMIDVRKQAQPVLGFGVNIWPGDVRAEDCFTDLSMNWARLWLGFSSSSDVVPAGQTMPFYQKYWKTWLDANPKRLSAVKISTDMAARHNVTVMVLMGHVPKCWVESHGGYDYLMKGDNYEPFSHTPHETRSAQRPGRSPSRDRAC